jgi:hypothetical protein
MKTMTPQQACDRLQNLTGVLSAGVFCSSENAPEPVFTCADTEHKDWPNVFRAAVKMFHLLNETRVQITMDDYTVVIETKDGWTIAVAAPLGHSVRKSLRRVYNQLFRKLAARQAPANVVQFPK